MLIPNPPGHTWKETSMRHSPARLNRFWLAVIGLVLLVGAAVLVTATAGLLGTVVPGAPTPSIGSPVVALDPAAAAAPALQGGLVAGGILLAVLGLAWLLAQVPRRRRTRTYRLQAAEDNGLVSLDPALLEGALDKDIEQLPDVRKSRSVLRGSAAEPDITIRATLDHRAPVADVVRSIREGAVERLAASLEAAPRTVAVIIDVSTASRTRNVTQ
jgi:hypothetical protein